MTFGEKIKKIRKDKKMTQSELAQKMNCTKVMISQYEHGQRKPKLETIEKFARALGVSPGVFFLSGNAPIDEEITEEVEKQLLEDDAIIPFEDQEAPKEKILIDTFNSLNETGQNKVIEYTKDIFSISKYTE